MLISVIICLETISLFRLLGCCRGQVVRFFAAVIVLVLLVGICGFGLGGVPCFLLTVIASNVLSCVHKDFLLNENMNVLFNLG